jgi:hypothetical protein
MKTADALSATILLFLSELFPLELFWDFDLVQVVFSYEVVNSVKK